MWQCSSTRLICSLSVRTDPFFPSAFLIPFTYPSDSSPSNLSIEATALIRTYLPSARYANNLSFCSSLGNILTVIVSVKSVTSNITMSFPVFVSLDSKRMILPYTTTSPVMPSRSAMPIGSSSKSLPKITSGLSDSLPYLLVLPLLRNPFERSVSSLPFTS